MAICLISYRYKASAAGHGCTQVYPILLFIYLFCQKSKLEGEKSCSDLNTDSINQSSGCWISRGRKGKATSGHRHTWPTWKTGGGAHPVVAARKEGSRECGSGVKAMTGDEGEGGCNAGRARALPDGLLLAWTLDACTPSAWRGRGEWRRGVRCARIAALGLSVCGLENRGSNSRLQRKKTAL
jgi:hypothetical protein